MEPRAAAYVFAGAGTGETMRANREAFRRRRIVPRMLRDVGERDLSTKVLGTDDARASAAGADRRADDRPPRRRARQRRARRRSSGCRSWPARPRRTRSSEIAEAGGPRWFQLYWPNDPELAESMVSRAEAAGYEAIVVTVDTFIPGWKPRDLQQAWLPFLEGVGNANYLQDPVFRAALEKPPEEDLGAAIGHYLSIYVESLADLGRPRVAARAHLAADPDQGHPPPRRRARGAATAARRA